MYHFHFFVNYFTTQTNIFIIHLLFIFHAIGECYQIQNIVNRKFVIMLMQYIFRWTLKKLITE